MDLYPDLLAAESDEKEDDGITSKAKKFLKENPVQFCSIPLDYFYFKSQVDEAGEPDRKRLLRLKKEIEILRDALPEGIYVLVNEDQIDIMKVVIAGPGDTPYENGLYHFDMYIPSNYPSSPPKMNYLTHGSGQFYINPNLYTSGYVCFSLLGTWAGPGWTEESTLLQLLVSIQAMILRDSPVVNEPSYSTHQNTPTSRLYDHAVRQAALTYAMHWHLKDAHAIAEADLITRAHFLTSKTQILEQLDKWCDLHQNFVREDNATDYFSFSFPEAFGTTADAVRSCLETVEEEFSTKLDQVTNQ